MGEARGEYLLVVCDRGDTLLWASLPPIVELRVVQLDGEGPPELAVEVSTGGHCCYESLLPGLVNEGPSGQFTGLEGDGRLELVAGNEGFAYFGCDDTELDYPERPWVPAIFALREGRYREATRDFRKYLAKRRDSALRNRELRDPRLRLLEREAPEVARQVEEIRRALEEAGGQVLYELNFWGL